MIRFVLPMVFFAAGAQAQSVKLTANEIEILLSGNTAIWQSGDVTYRQYFGTDGVTNFTRNGAELVQGDWRVDSDLDEYQSMWPNDETWTGLFVMEFAGDWYWVSKATPPTPFSMLDGDQLDTE